MRYAPSSKCQGLTKALAFLAAAAPAATAQSSVSGSVFDSLRTSAPLSGASVVIADLARYTSTDARGRFSFDSVPAGKHAITFLHPVLDSLELGAPAVLIDVPLTGRLTVPLATPSPASVFARLCPGDHDAATGLLLGRVRDVDTDAPLAYAAITGSWWEYLLENGGMHGHYVRASTTSNERGVYVLCAVPADVSYEVAVLASGHFAGPIPVEPTPKLLTKLNLAVSRRDSAAELSASAFLVTMRAGPQLLKGNGSASLSGTITAAGAARPSAAMVTLFGSELAAHADSVGRFRLNGIPAGTHALQLRAIGAPPTIAVVDFPSGAGVDTTLKLDPLAHTLTEVTVVASAPGARSNVNGMADRVGLGLGHFVTEEEMTKRPQTEFLGYLMRLPGIVLQVNAAGKRYLQMRGGNGLSNVRFCSPSYFLDGVYFPLDDPRDPLGTLVNFARGDQLKGIEVYTSAGSIPPRFDRSSFTGCGSVVIWTK